MRKGDLNEEEKKHSLRKFNLQGTPFYNCIFYGSHIYQIFPEGKWLFNQEEVKLVILYMKILYFFESRDLKLANQVIFLFIAKVSWIN